MAIAFIKRIYKKLRSRWRWYKFLFEIGLIYGHDDNCDHKILNYEDD